MKRPKIRPWELLAVLAIILVVTAILFPVFQKPRETTGRRNCNSNLKQIALGLIQYVQDNDEAMPDIAFNRTGSVTWRTVLYPYIKANSLFQCPDRQSHATATDGYPVSYAANYSGDYSGASNDWGDGAFAGLGSRPVTLADVNDPAHLIALCEVQNTPGPEFNIDHRVPAATSAHVLWTGPPEPDTRYGSYFLLMDGHAKFFLPTVTAAYVEPGTTGQVRPLNLWFRDPSRPLPPASLSILKEAEVRGSQ